MASPERAERGASAGVLRAVAVPKVAEDCSIAAEHVSAAALAAHAMREASWLDDADFEVEHVAI